MDSVAFFNRTYDEALALAREARDYLSGQEPIDRAALSPAHQLSESCETMRLTARITQVIAWLLVQRAVHEGEITREEATRPGHRLSGQCVCNASLADAEEVLPHRLRDLLERSHRLYTRIERLDSMLARS